MEYSESIEWLFAQLPMFSRVGAAAYKPGLERSIALAEHFGNPQNKFRSIHIAGTNGKGSTSHLIAATLQAAGYKTALYTSPHLVDFRERMRINGKMISKEKVSDFVGRWRAAGYSGDRPSFFELTMMMAFRWFADEKVDYAVIETGMGGRLDSTNIITPKISVITNISKDHTQFLGHTLEAIAREKAGIIKAGVPVVIGEAEDATERVFRERAAAIHSPIREAYREIDAGANAALHCSLHGDYQQKNINTARVAIDELRQQGVKISHEAMKQGFSEVNRLTGLRGRWSVEGTSPLVICDTGHNEAGLRYNMAQLRKEMMTRPQEAHLRFVIGFVADKDICNILPLLPKEGIYYATQAQIPRALGVSELTSQMAELGYEVHPYKNVAAAYAAAKEDCGGDDVIYIGGSTFIVADFYAAQAQSNPSDS